MILCNQCGKAAADGLRFCVECGMDLVSPRNESFSPGAVTLPLDSSDDRNRASHSEPLQTYPPKFMSMQKPLMASPTGGESAVNKHQWSPSRVVGITAVAMFLIFALGGAITWLFIRSNSNKIQGSVRTATAFSQTVETPVPSPPDRTLTTGNTQNSIVTEADRMEQKVVQGIAINQTELRGLTRNELRLLRNAVYARHGRRFSTVDLQQYFDSTPWYRSRADYRDSDLTDTDRYNLNLIQKNEK